MDINSVVSKGSQPQYPFMHKGKLHWLKTLPEQGGRIALMMNNGDLEPLVITPPEYNIRTRVNEYGGKCFCVIDQWMIFNNFKDGCLYAQEIRPDSVPVALTAGDDQVNVGFADLVPSHAGQWIAAIMETCKPDSENVCSIVVIYFSQTLANQGSESPIITLATGADFYASPVISPNDTALAWMEWSHPYMPWDQTRLMYADLLHGRFVSLSNPVTIVDKPDCAVSQPGFLNNGDLVFASDSCECDFWNLYQYNHKDIIQISKETAEFGEAHWVFGHNRWCTSDDRKIIAIVSEFDGDRIVLLDPVTRHILDVSPKYASCSHIHQDDDGGYLFIASHENRPAEIIRITQSEEYDAVSVRDGPQKNLLPDTYSKPVFVKFPSTDNQEAYAYYYAPHNPRFQGIEGTLPPLVVMVHGGPTSRATRAYAGIKQYFCSLGFAVLDINHRGSTGFGRTYRQSLLGNWGVYDCDDIRAGIQYTLRNGLANPDQIFIRGSSAGGYAVLRALTRHSDLFCAGASYYGIGNLITLSEITHKFESRYTDRLIGEVFDADLARRAESLFTRRSPVFDMGHLQCPLILFQGAKDKIVPPQLAQEVIMILKDKGISHSYHEYDDEGHGFRQQKNLIASLLCETTFFADNIRHSSSKTKTTGASK